MFLAYDETRNFGATYFLPTQNEWYKAAYYNPSAATYWTYPTQSNTAPINTLSRAGPNNANYNNYDTATQTNDYTDATNLLTPVGAFSLSPGPFGTYDMGGDVWQWAEANIVEECTALRGGFYYLDSGELASSVRGYEIPGWVSCADDVGFRVASVPEPSTIALLLASAACLLGYAWRRRASS